MRYDYRMTTFTKTTYTLPWETHQLYTWCLEPATRLEDAPTIILMHGAGTADSTRTEGLAETYAGHGVRVISFDFVGHGKTGGAMRDMTLRLRTEVAKVVIDHWTVANEQLILSGASMSGHTALRLTDILGDRVTALALMAPAIYAAAAEEVLFTEEFSNIIRTENSWQDSLALRNAEAFMGKVHILLGADDPVIPWGVAQHLLTTFRTNASEVRFDMVRGPGHGVSGWQSAHPERGTDVLQYLLRPAEVIT